MKNLLLSLIMLLLMAFNASGGELPGSGGGNIFWESGKIYVVVAVIAIIFAGIILYLISIDRKVGRMEKELKNKQ
jgi:CcmD family protein